MSHHPPICASFCKGKKANFTIWQTSDTKSKFKGTFLEFSDVYKTYVELLDFGERYQLNNPCVSAHNIIIGTMYIDIGGSASVKIIGNSNIRAVLNYTKKGWFSKEEYKIDGFVEKYNGS